MKLVIHKLTTNHVVSNIMVIAILLLPILRYYDVPLIGLNMETVLLLFIFVFEILLYLSTPQNRMEKAILKKPTFWFSLFGLWMVAVTFYYEIFTDINTVYSSGNYSINALLFMLAVISVIILLMQGRFVADSFGQIYSFFVAIIFVIILLQWILKLCGITVSFQLLPYTSAWAFLNGSAFGMTANPIALFSERAHLAQYLVPYITLCLYSDNIIYKNRLLKALVVSFIIVSTASGNGVIIVFMEWLMYILIFGKIKKRSRIFVFIGGIIALVCIYVMLSKIPLFYDVFNRLFVDNSGNQYHYAKADYRIYRGLNIYSQLPFGNQLCGVGYRHMHMFAQLHNIVSEYDLSTQAYEYFSAFFQIMIYTGAVGMVLYFRSMWLQFKHGSYCTKGFLVVTLALFVSSSILFDSIHIMYVLITICIMKCDTLMTD